MLHFHIAPVECGGGHFAGPCRIAASITGTRRQVECLIKAARYYFTNNESLETNNLPHSNTPCAKSFVAGRSRRTAVPWKRSAGGGSGSALGSKVSKGGAAIYSRSISFHRFMWWNGCRLVD